MLQLKKIFINIVWVSFFMLVGVQQIHAQARGHASVGLGHGAEGYLPLEVMIKDLEFGLYMPDAGKYLKYFCNSAIKHEKDALKHYNV